MPAAPRSAASQRAKLLEADANSPKADAARLPAAKIEKEGRTGVIVQAAMALPAKKVSLSVIVVILLLFSAASFYVHSRSRSYGKIQSTWDDRDYESYFRYYVNFQTPRGAGKYQAYFVLLWKHPNGEAMDDKDARRRWYQSFLPSTLTDSGERRLLHCYPFQVNGFLAILTRAEALALASKPGIRRMSSNEKYISSAASCAFETRAGTKRSLVRSRPAF